ncbi:hypothetical protein ACIQMY_13530 [Streptomyces sp. NPDC091368]|uniref:hypothetical protein n=1 Tax=Streptomyces sp. NPDC091368 TaxID=3365993 RepID=UPI003812BA75
MDCERPGRGPEPADGVCPDCTAAVAAAAAAFRERFALEAEQKAAAAGFERQRATELAAEIERERQEQAADEEAARTARLAAQQALMAGPDDETAELRAQMLAEHPWMATYATKPQQQATAPF